MKKNKHLNYSVSVRNSNKNSKIIRYPNQAGRQYYIDRFIDGLLAVVSSFGFILILFFLVLI